MNFKNDLTAKYMESILDYNPETGELKWKVFRGSRAKKGQIAGCTVAYKNNRYRKLQINKKNYFAHRIIYCLMTDEWPEYEIDHIDGNGLNNKWANLRAATRSQNNMNRKGLKGVTWDKGRKKWFAKIKKNHKQYFLGRYNNKEDAIQAYNKAALKHFGEFAKLNEMGYD